MQKQAGTLQSFGYVEQNTGEAIWAVLVHSVQFWVSGVLLLTKTAMHVWMVGFIPCMGLILGKTLPSHSQDIKDFGLYPGSTVRLSHS